MILKQLSVVSISQGIILKQYNFKSYGVNLILGVKRGESEESNGVGKSAMIDSIRYLLGSNIPKQFSNNQSLNEEDIFFILHIITNTKSLYIGRRIKEKNKGYYLESDKIELDLSKWEIEEDDTKYKLFVQKLIFGDNIDNNAPTFSALREYIIRDEKSGYVGIELKNRNALQVYRNLAFLAQLPFDYEKEFQPLKDENKELNKQLAAIKCMEGEILQLRNRHARLQVEVSKLSKIVTDVDLSQKYDVDEEEYKNNKIKLRDIQGKIFELQHIVKQYKKNILELEEKTKKLKNLNELEEFYQQLLGYFPDELKKNYSQMQEFYDFMLDNRGGYFKEKIKEIENELVSLNTTKTELKKIVIQAGKILSNTELVDDINAISEELTAKTQELAEVNLKIQTYDSQSEINTNINNIKSEIISKNQKYEIEFKEYDAQIKALEDMFKSLLTQAYSADEGYLKYKYENKADLKSATGRIKIDCQLADEQSHGRLYMKINLFDLTWFLNRVDKKQDIQFLIHDGSYCKPDALVKERVLKYVNKYLEKRLTGQYFVTANVDELTQETLTYLRQVKGVVAELDRNMDENRFLGFKYQTT